MVKAHGQQRFWKRGYSMRRFAVVLAVVGMLAVANPVLADPITYSVRATASGTLGGSAFTSALVTIALTGDTSAVSGSPIQTNPGIATVDVSGVGTATFTNALLAAFVNPTPLNLLAGISDLTADRLILGTRNPVFASYDLRTPIGPITGGAPFNDGFIFPTTLGDFVLTSINGGTSTFTAVVPEPASAVLVVAGLLGIISIAMKRRRTLLPLIKPKGPALPY